MQDYTKLKVWQKAHELVLAAYPATGHFPKEELYGLTSQLRRVLVSIPANIAEGCGRNSNAELLHFLHIAMGSASEVEYCFLLTHDFHWLDDDTYQHLSGDIHEVKRMLGAFIWKLKTDNRQLTWCTLMRQNELS